MSMRAAFLAGLIGVAAWGGSAQAADTATGKKLAQKLCVNCHIVEPDGKQDQVTAGVPSFMAIARKAEQTEDKLRSFILNPHPPMPQVQFTTNELNNVVAYIMTLADGQ